MGRENTNLIEGGPFFEFLVDLVMLLGLKQLTWGIKSSKFGLDLQMKQSFLCQMKPRPRKSKPSFGNQMLIASQWGLGAYIRVVMGSAKTTSLVLSMPLNIFRWNVKAREKHENFWGRSTNSLRVLGRKLLTTSPRVHVIVGDTKSIPNMRNLLGICREGYHWPHLVH